MTRQTWKSGKAIRSFFADPVTFYVRTGSNIAIRIATNECWILTRVDIHT